MANRPETVTNAKTGGQKDGKDIKLLCAPPQAMEELGRVYSMGSAKYEPHNFRKGFDWSLSYDALYRHLLRSIDGEDRDPESGYLHMAHVAWHALTLCQFVFDKEAGKQPDSLDDRFRAIRFDRYFSAGGCSVENTASPGVDSEGDMCHSGNMLEPPFIYENCQQFDCGCEYGVSSSQPKGCLRAGCPACLRGEHLLCGSC